MRPVPLGERSQQLLVMIALARELLADPLDVSLLRVTFGDLPVGLRQRGAAGLQETQI
jgi:hypothetical protein